MSISSRQAADKTAKETHGMTLLQSIIDQGSETADDAKTTNDQNSFVPNICNNSADQKIQPAAKNCGDLRLARSLTNGRKPRSSSSGNCRLSASNQMRSYEHHGRLLPPPLPSPYEPIHKQRLVTKYQELGRLLYEAMQPKTPRVNLSQQHWAVPVKLHRTPKHSVQKSLLLDGSYPRLAMSAPSYRKVAEDKGYLQLMQEKEEEVIDIISQGSRTDTPQVEIVEVFDDMKDAFSGQSSGKHVTFNPEATIRGPYAGFVSQRAVDVLQQSDKSSMHRPDIDIRRAKTETSLLKLPKNKQNKENELGSKQKNEENVKNKAESYSYNDKRNSSLDRQYLIRSQSNAGNHFSLHGRLEKSLDITDGMISGTLHLSRSRSPRASQQLFASWSYPARSGSLDQHILSSDHQVNSTDNIEVRNWLKQKNRLLRKQRREEKMLERKIQKEESEKQREKNKHILEYKEKVRQWMKEKKRENLLKKCKTKQLNPGQDLSRQQAEFLRNKKTKKTDASQELERNTLNGEMVDVKSERKLRAKSTSSETRQSIPGRSAVREERAKNTEQQKRTAFHEWRKVDKENTQSNVTEKHTENVTEDGVIVQHPERRKARGRSEAVGKSISETMQLDCTASDKVPSLHNKQSRDNIYIKSSEDRLDPQGCEFKETSNCARDGNTEEDIRCHNNSTKGLNSLAQNRDENSDGDMDKRILDEENQNVRDHDWKTNLTSTASKLHNGTSENKDLTDNLYQEKESYSSVDGKFYQEEDSRVRSHSSRSHGRETRVESRESQHPSAAEDVIKQDLYHVNDHKDANIQLHYKRDSLDAASNIFIGKKHISTRSSSPNRSEETNGFLSENHEPDSAGFVHKSKCPEMTTQPSDYTEHNVASSRQGSLEKTFPNTNQKKEHINKFARSSGLGADLQHTSLLNSAENGEQQNLILSGSPHAKQGGDWAEKPEEISPRNFKPLSEISSSHSKSSIDVHSDYTNHKNGCKDTSRRQSIVEEEPNVANQLSGNISLGYHAVEKQVGGIAHSQNTDDLSPFKGEAKDMASRNSVQSQNAEGLLLFKAQNRDLPSRSSVHSVKDEDLSFNEDTKDVDSRNSARSQNVDDFSSFRAKTRDMTSRNSVHSQIDEILSFLKAEARDRVSRNSAHSEKDDDLLPWKTDTRDMTSRNSAKSQNEKDLSLFKAETKDIASKNSAQSQNDEDLKYFKEETRNTVSKHSASTLKDENVFSFREDAGYL